jgi:hypothetical protein
VTSFLCVSPIHPLVNGIPFHTPSFHNNRFASSRMEATEEATSTQGLKPDKVHTWKRRREELLRSSNRSHLWSNQAPAIEWTVTGHLQKCFRSPLVWLWSNRPTYQPELRFNQPGNRWPWLMCTLSCPTYPFAFGI